MSEKGKNVFFLVVNFVLSSITLALTVTLISNIVQENGDLISLFLALAILSDAFYKVLLFLKYKDDRLRIGIEFLICLAAMVTAYFARQNYILFFISTALVVLSIAMNRLLKVFIRDDKKKKKNVIPNLIFGIILLALCVAILININEDNQYKITVIAAIALSYTVIKNMILPSFSLEKTKLLVGIITKTHVYDVIVYLLALMIAVSFVLPAIEPEINDFWDALWYCFAVVTTIGFGDFYAITPLGRVLTVLLGVYGIVIVAILTSVVVNYYNTVTAKERRNEENTDKL